MTKSASTGFALGVPDIQWQEDSLPYCRNFQDIYFPSGESEQIVWHDFIVANNLPEAWHNKDIFTITELGFGTGFNFLVTSKLWETQKSDHAWLHYISCELSPLGPEQISRAISGFTELKPYLKILLDRYPTRTRGFHRVIFERQRISLTLLFGDAAECLSQLQARVDAWYLDGFAPSKNLELWSERIFAEMARLSHPGSTFGTYSAAGFVRRGLQAAGFEVERRKGSGNKRESLRGSFRSNNVGLTPLARPSRIAVIGAGLAGLCIADAFARRGVEVVLLEEQGEIASKASGNRAGVLLPYITARPTLLSRLYLSGFSFSNQTLENIKDSGQPLDWERSGVIHFPSTKRLRKLFDNLNTLGLPEELVLGLSTETVSRMLGSRSELEAFFYPRGSYVTPPQVCNALLNRANKFTAIHYNQKVKELRHMESHWHIQCEHSEFEADQVIIANAYQARDLPMLDWLPLEAVRGQLFCARPKVGPSHICCYDGYSVPLKNGEVLIGASYSHKDFNPEVRESENLDLIARYQQCLPHLQLSSADIQESRVCFRTSSYDRLPLVGRVPDLKLTVSSGEYCYTQGLFLAAGFGSRGFISCPLAAELLASQVLDEPLPLEQDLAQTLNPLRYLLRCQKRGELIKLCQ